MLIKALPTANASSASLPLSASESRIQVTASRRRRQSAGLPPTIENSSESSENSPPFPSPRRMTPKTCLAKTAKIPTTTTTARHGHSLPSSGAEPRNRRRARPRRARPANKSGNESPPPPKQRRNSAQRHARGANPASTPRHARVARTHPPGALGRAPPSERIPAFGGHVPQTVQFGRDSDMSTER